MYKPGCSDTQSPQVGACCHEGQRGPGIKGTVRALPSLSHPTDAGMGDQALPRGFRVGKKTGFLTLTYDDEHLPWKGSLFPRDWQTFMKRLRKDYGLPVKYYMCGEYGPLHLRPHFHAVMYGLSRAEQDLVKNAWGKGRVGIGMITYDACAYVASYVNGKKYGGELAKSRLGNLLPEFQLLSKGIGERWCIANENYLKWNQLVTVKGKPVGIPRYYVKKLELDITARNDKLNDETRQKNELVQEKYNFRIPWDYQKKTNAQRALNIQAKQDLRERKDIL